MALTIEDSMYQGFKQCVDALFSPALKKTRSEQLAAEKIYQEMMTQEDFAQVRKVMDDQDDSFLMSRTMAQFFLYMAQRTFQTHLENTKDSHPFRPTQKTKVSKGDVLEWHKQLIRQKHNWKGKAVRSGRDIAGRVYLVDPKSNLILADAKLSSISHEDVLLAIGNGADLKIMHLADALTWPWLNKTERLIWANAYEELQRFEAEHV